MSRTPAVAKPLKQLRHVEREMLSPVQRVQIGLHPWVGQFAYRGPRAAGDQESLFTR